MNSKIKTPEFVNEVNNARFNLKSNKPFSSNNLQRFNLQNPQKHNAPKQLPLVRDRVQPRIPTHQSMIKAGKKFVGRRINPTTGFVEDHFQTDITKRTINGTKLSAHIDPQRSTLEGNSKLRTLTGKDSRKVDMSLMSKVRLNKFRFEKDANILRHTRNNVSQQIYQPDIIQTQVKRSTAGGGMKDAFLKPVMTDSKKRNDGVFYLNPDDDDVLNSVDLRALQSSVNHGKIKFGFQKHSDVAIPRIIDFHQEDELQHNQRDVLIDEVFIGFKNDLPGAIANNNTKFHQAITDDLQLKHEIVPEFFRQKQNVVPHVGNLEGKDLMLDPQNGKNIEVVPDMIFEKDGDFIKSNHSTNLISNHEKGDDPRILVQPTENKVTSRTNGIEIPGLKQMITEDMDFQTINQAKPTRVLDTNNQKPNIAHIETTKIQLSDGKSFIPSRQNEKQTFRNEQGSMTQKFMAQQLQDESNRHNFKIRTIDTSLNQPRRTGASGRVNGRLHQSQVINDMAGLLNKEKPINLTVNQFIKPTNITSKKL